MTGFWSRLAGRLPFSDPLPQPSPEAEAVLNAITDELIALIAARPIEERGRSRGKLSESASWEALKKAPADRQMEVALCGIVVNSRDRSLIGGGWEHWARLDIPMQIASQILRDGTLPFAEPHLVPLLRAAVRRPNPAENRVPIGPLLGACERYLDGTAATGDLRRGLEALLSHFHRHGSGRTGARDREKQGRRILEMLEPGTRTDDPTPPEGEFRTALQDWLDGLPDRSRRDWEALIAHLGQAVDRSKPTRAWRKEAAPLLDAVGRDRAADRFVAWMDTIALNPSREDPSLDIARGAIWLCADLDPAVVVPSLGRFATVCFKKIAWVGARSVKLGNACLLTLETMAEHDAAVAELARLRTVITYPSVRSQIDERLDRVADDRQTTVEDLAEASLGDFGLDADGTAETVLGDAIATIAVTTHNVTLGWRTADGKPRKAAPVDVKRNFPDDLKALKARAKAIDAARKAVLRRLEDGWVEGRDWDVADWRARFMDHPVRAPIARGLIWRIGTGDQAQNGMRDGDRLTDLAGRAVDLPDGARVALWHPLDSPAEDVLAWRRRIMARGITQPLKQAYREIYVLTDAERRTGTYSNRFAAHILRQHPFHALCRARGWRYDLMGDWDSHNMPERHVPARGLSIDFTVETVETAGASGIGVFLHLASDRIGFIDDQNGPMRLESVPPIVFSELMRDVDLFVAVTSVANDPNWTDGGPDGRFGIYWREHAFGDLSQTAETRRDVLADILPKLAIADRVKIVGRFLEVQGKLNRYRIHLGSSNIQILPDNVYLCIVPAYARGRAVALPFEDDAMLAIILSKAFMLIDDDKITDEAILRQMKR
ncbi:MAG: DUF4132 domain-containing protein [Inquilinaceae bacterium]